MKNKKILSVFFSTLMALSLSGCNDKDSSSTVESSSKEESNVITIAEAIAIATETGSKLTDKEYQITGIIETVSNAMFGEMTIKDDTGSLYIYGVFDKDREIRYDALSDKPIKGDEVTLLGKLKCFNGKPEMDRGYLQSFRHISVEENIDLSQYIESTIANARTVADGTKMKLTGVVTRITYANGYKPNGFYLVGDNSSIYVYGGDIAATVSEGNKVTIACEKAYFILEDEKTYAANFGYEGSCQVDNAYLISNDNKTNTIDLSWCQEKTVKEILDTPLSTNITNEIYKVNALVKKVPGQGFVNYYFDDLDGETGSYTYTMCNGGDFAWLDKFDNKICTVYLTAINCKSTNTGCIYRFMPILVIDENYIFDVANAPKFALEYYATEQFAKEYEGDPELEVITSASSTLLNFENAVISYKSSDTNVAYFETSGDKTLFRTNNPGTTTITITATYGAYFASSDVEVTVKTPSTVDYVTVSEAVSASKGEEVTVKGIVSAATANQKSGFYLIDATGIVAVRLVDIDTLKSIKIGQEVVIKGTRTDVKTSQICIDTATVVSNLQGNHAYSTDSFETVTFDELYDKSQDNSTNKTASGYTVSGKISVSRTNYSTNYYLTDDSGSKSILFYSGSGLQYAYLLDEYEGKSITMDVAICDWNAKGNKLCAISVITEDGKIPASCNWN